MNIETKLSRFSESVRKEAEAQNALRAKALEDKYEASVSEFNKKAHAKYKEMAEDASIQAEKLKQKRIAEASAEVKRALMQKRADYVKKVFDNVMEGLLEYFNTPAYESLIVEHIESYKTMSGGPDKITAQIMERDKALIEAVKAKCGVKVVTVDEDFLGGVRIILDESRVADCTMRSRFEAEKARFNKIRIL